MNYDRITKMEFNLHEIEAATKDLQEALDRLKLYRKQAKDLYSYYGSEAWHKDREEHSAAVDKKEDVPKAGVLSEDLIYDSITELRDTAFTMLELGTEILKEWI